MSKIEKVNVKKSLHFLSVSCAHVLYTCPVLSFESLATVKLHTAEEKPSESTVLVIYLSLCLL